jgi:hypothetical protein
MKKSSFITDVPMLSTTAFLRNISLAVDINEYFGASTNDSHKYAMTLGLNFLCEF